MTMGNHVTPCNVRHVRIRIPQCIEDPNSKRTFSVIGGQWNPSARRYPVSAFEIPHGHGLSSAVVLLIILCSYIAHRVVDGRCNSFGGVGAHHDHVFLLGSRSFQRNPVGQLTGIVFWD